MVENKKVNLFSALGVLFFVAGFIFFFIKFWLGLLLLFVSFGFNLHIKKHYPDEFKKIVENGKPNSTKTYNIIHIEGLNFFDNNSKIKISMPENKIIFSNNTQTSEFLFSDIEHAAILEEVTNELKNKSVVIRTVAGLMLCPAAALVGGLSALTPTYKKHKNYYLQIKTKSGKNIILAGKVETLKKIKETILKNV